MSDAKRKIYAKRLILISALLLIIIGIISTYLGAANLYKYMWWSSNYGGENTDSGMWTEEAVMSYIIWGSFFLVTGILGILGGLILIFRGIPAVTEGNRSYLRKILLPLGIIGLLPSPGLVITGILLLFTWRMYSDDRYDFFGLLLEDVTSGPRPMPGGPMPSPAGASFDGRGAYATGYQMEESMYASDYSQASYGGGSGAYTARAGPTSLLEQEYTEPAIPAAAEPETPTASPVCPSCGKATEWIEEYNRHYCYDCDTYA